MPMTLNYPIKKTLVAVSALLLTGAVQAQSFSSTVQAESRINSASATTQDRVSQIASQTQDIIAEYRNEIQKYDSLKVYNDNLEEIVADQRRELLSINNQLEGLENTNRDIVPLMLEMIAGLEVIVNDDIPFRREERQSRVQRMKADMNRSDVTTSEKYRRIMDIYQGELNYGRTTEAYEAKVESGPDAGKLVDFLRVGRTLLIYQTQDGESTGWYNPAAKEFEHLDNSYRSSVKNGLAIAYNRKAPGLVKLPVPGAEAGQ